MPGLVANMLKYDASRRYFARGIVGAVLVSSIARAAPPTRRIASALKVTRNECFDEASLAAAVDTWLDGREVDARLAVTVEGTVGAGKGFSFALRRDGQLVSERHFSTPGVSCAAFTAILSLAISMAIDASLVEELTTGAPPAPRANQPDPSPEPSPTAVSPAPNSPPLEQPRAREPSAAHSSRLEIDFGAVGLADALPTPTIGMELGAELSASRSISLRADALGASGVLVPVGRGSADVSLVAAGASGCFVYPRTAVKVRVCVGGKVGQLTAQGLDYLTSDTTHPLWAAATLRFDAGLELAPKASIRASTELLVLVVRPELEEVSTSGTILASSKLPAVGLAFGLSPSVAFW